MSKRALPGRWVLWLAVVLAAGLGAQRWLHPTPRHPWGDLQLHALGEGAFVYRGLVSNSGVLVLSGGVLVVDAQVSRSAAGRLRAAIRTVTKEPIRWVVLTHAHADHTGGASLFAEDGAAVIATDETAERLRAGEDELGAAAQAFGLPPPRAPRVAVAVTQPFRTQLSLQLGGERVELFDPGPTETPGGALVWIPGRRLLFAGDAVQTDRFPSGGVPFRAEGLSQDGSWTAALGKIAKLQPELLVAGHGPALRSSGEILRRLGGQGDIFESSLAVAREERTRGATPHEAIRRIEHHLSGFGGLSGYGPGFSGAQEIALRAWSCVAAQPGAQTPWELRSRPAVATVSGAETLGARAFGELRSALEAQPLLAGADWLMLAQQDARRALQERPDQTQAQAVLAAAQVIAQTLDGEPGSEERAALRKVALRPELTGPQRRSLRELLAWSARAEGLGPEAEQELSQALPAPLRPALGLLRQRLLASE